MESGQGDTNDKQKFDLLYGNLCEIGKTLLDSTAKVTGFLLLAAGWIATSKDMRAFLKEDEISAYLAVAALIGAFVFYAIAAMRRSLVFTMLNVVTLNLVAVTIERRTLLTADHLILCLLFGKLSELDAITRRARTMIVMVVVE